jgi:hypothetical protein
MNKQELGLQMWNMNYSLDAIEQAEDILDLINEDLETGKSQDLESALDEYAIYHRRVR